MTLSKKYCRIVKVRYFRTLCACSSVDRAPASDAGLSQVRLLSGVPEKRTCFDKSFFLLYLPTASYIATQLYSAMPSDIVLAQFKKANII